MQMSNLDAFECGVWRALRRKCEPDSASRSSQSQSESDDSISKKTKSPEAKPRGLFGAATQIRTGDLILTKDVLYQLSHSSMFANISAEQWYYSKKFLFCQYIFLKKRKKEFSAYPCKILRCCCKFCTPLKCKHLFSKRRLCKTVGRGTVEECTKRRRFFRSSKTRGIA